MNGRIYDPELGRFIQADPMVEPDAKQGLNRYSYVLNNPLSGTDPSGYLNFRQLFEDARRKFGHGFASAGITQSFSAVVGDC